MASAIGLGIINYPKPRWGDRFCVRKNGANRAAAPSGANGLDANISHGLRRGLPALPAAATPWLKHLKEVPLGYRQNGSFTKILRAFRLRPSGNELRRNSSPLVPATKKGSPKRSFSTVSIVCAKTIWQLRIVC